jgi:hypothetical protein
VSTLRIQSCVGHPPQPCCLGTPPRYVQGGSMNGLISTFLHRQNLYGKPSICVETGKVEISPLVNILRPRHKVYLHLRYPPSTLVDAHLIRLSYTLNSRLATRLHPIPSRAQWPYARTCAYGLYYRFWASGMLTIHSQPH